MRSAVAGGARLRRSTLSWGNIGIGHAQVVRGGAHEQGRNWSWRDTSPMASILLCEWRGEEGWYLGMSSMGRGRFIWAIIVLYNAEAEDRVGVPC